MKDIDMVKKVILSCQFLTPPVFLYGDEDEMLKSLGYVPQKVSGPVDISNLPISASLREAIAGWDQQYQNTFNRPYPPDSGFSSPDLKVAHVKQGTELARRLQEELGEGYSVEYKP
ncbi:hypothetical protein [Ciceribacter sp. RN22]|uniref:hypothetical protein n=1 Tax=Ciceribacter sp. RN22 TaxID=2954932 RepID=UPI0020920C49|nr:hypothetical protein [Ciceribacter sp. RN22]MCO6181126.1 hypothetical protein [Ciceribacter sp. RN22]